MKIIVNGEHANCSDSLTVGELLVQQKVKTADMVSVELKRQILRRIEFDEKALKDKAKVEFLYFVGGGSGTDRATKTAL
jgi:sulfur carrier protein